MIDIIIPYGNIEKVEWRRDSFLECIWSIDKDKFNIIISDISSESEFNFIRQAIDHDFIYLYNRNPSPRFNKSYSINKGFQLVKSDFFLICDADIVFPNECFINKNCDILKFKLDYNTMVNRKLIPTNHCVYNRYLGGIFGITKNAFNRVEGFNENFFGWGHEDTEFTFVVESKQIEIIKSDTIFKVINPNLSDWEANERALSSKQNECKLRERII